MEVKDQNITLNTFDWRLLVTSIGVMSSLFTKGNTEGIKASSRTIERKVRHQMLIYNSEELLYAQLTVTNGKLAL